MFAFVIHLPYKHTKLKKNHLIINWQVKGHNSITKQRNRIGARTSNWSSSTVTIVSIEKNKNKLETFTIFFFYLNKHRHIKFSRIVSFHDGFVEFLLQKSTFMSAMPILSSECISHITLCVVFSLKFFTKDVF